AADQPAGDAIDSGLPSHWKELTFHMDLPWFIGRTQCGVGRSAHQDDSETGRRSVDALGAAAPHPSSPWFFGTVRACHGPCSFRAAETDVFLRVRHQNRPAGERYTSAIVPNSPVMA